MATLILCLPGGGEIELNNTEVFPTVYTGTAPNGAEVFLSPKDGGGWQLNLNQDGDLTPIAFRNDDDPEGEYTSYSPYPQGYAVKEPGGPSDPSGPSDSSGDDPDGPSDESSEGSSSGSKPSSESSEESEEKEKESSSSDPSLSSVPSSRSSASMGSKSSSESSDYYEQCPCYQVKFVDTTTGKKVCVELSVVPNFDGGKEGFFINGTGFLIEFDEDSGTWGGQDDDGNQIFPPTGSGSQGDCPPFGTWTRVNGGDVKLEPCDSCLSSSSSSRKSGSKSSDEDSSSDESSTDCPCYQVRTKVFGEDRYICFELSPGVDDNGNPDFGFEDLYIYKDPVTMEWTGDFAGDELRPPGGAADGPCPPFGTWTDMGTGEDVELEPCDSCHSSSESSPGENQSSEESESVEVSLSADEEDSLSVEIVGPESSDSSAGQTA